jgi:hypothetical protein
MNLRDTNNTPEGYKDLLEFKLKAIEDYRNKIIDLKSKEKSGIQVYPIPNIQVIQNTLNGIYHYLYDIFFINYSMGKSLSDVTDDCLTVIDSMQGVWNKASGYKQIVTMLSAGIMFDILEIDFHKLVSLVKNDNPNDYLVDLLINYKMPEWKRKNSKFMWKKPYQAFEEIETLAKTDKEVAVIRLKKYLQKQWLPANNTNSRGKGYHSGYWSFESGAVVKIFDLDDTILKDLSFYPYDMVHF